MRGGKEGERKRKRQKEYLRIDKNIPYLIKKKKQKKTWTSKKYSEPPVGLPKRGSHLDIS